MMILDRLFIHESANVGRTPRGTVRAGFAGAQAISKGVDLALPLGWQDARLHACCILADNLGSPRGAAWCVFIFDHARHSGHRGSACLSVIRLKAGEPIPELSGKIVGLISEDLIDQWWGMEHISPIAPGVYFPTAAMGELIAAAGHVDARSPANMFRAEAQVQGLLCETMEAWRAGALVAAIDDVTLNLVERERLINARRLIETKFSEKLTIEGLARASGLGRAKLIRGFRLLYGQTVAECLAEKRLQAAARALRATQEPVSQIAYRSGYQSNAAFTRAFARRFGKAPSSFRSTLIAA